jgi:hypothetical protein
LFASPYSAPTFQGPSRAKKAKTKPSRAKKERQKASKLEAKKSKGLTKAAPVKSKGEKKVSKSKKSMEFAGAAAALGIITCVAVWRRVHSRATTPRKSPSHFV